MTRITLPALAIAASLVLAPLLASAGTIGWTPGEPTVTPGPGGIIDRGGLDRGNPHENDDDWDFGDICREKPVKEPFGPDGWIKLRCGDVVAIKWPTSIVPIPEPETPVEPEEPPVVVIPDPEPELPEQPAPIPGPPALPLLAAGLAGLALVRRARG